MAVTEITPISISLNTAFTIGGTTGTAINTSNTMEIPYEKEKKLLIVILSAHNDTNATFAVGNMGVANGAGSLSTGTIGNGVLKGIIVTSDRLKQKTGAGSSARKGILNISWATNSAGYLAAYQIP